jgi:hypothetical protein
MRAYYILQFNARALPGKELPPGDHDRVIRENENMSWKGAAWWHDNGEHQPGSDPCFELDCGVEVEVQVPHEDEGWDDDVVEILIDQLAFSYDLPEPPKKLELESLGFRHKVRDTVTEALKAAEGQRALHAECVLGRVCVNWADLSVVDVLYSQGLSAEPEFVIKVSEAAPDARALQSYVCRYVLEHIPELKDAGVSVHTEW